MSSSIIPDILKERHCCIFFWKTLFSIVVFMIMCASIGYGQQGKTDDAARQLVQLADSLSKQRNYDSALTIATQCLAILEASSDDGDTLTAKVHYRIGIYLMRLGRYPDSRQSMERAVEMARSVFRADHPFLASALGGLGFVLRTMGDFVAADTILRQSIELKEKSLGHNSPKLANSLYILTQVSQQLEHWPEVIDQAQRVLEIRRIQMSDGGAAREDTARYAQALSRLGDSYRLQGNMVVAGPLLRQAVRFFEDSGTANAYEAEVVNNLASYYIAIGSYRSAHKLYSQALDIWKEVHDANLWSGTINVALSLDLAGEYRAAELIYVEAIDSLRSTPGKDLTILAIAMTNLGNMYEKMNRLTLAEKTQREAKDVIGSVLGKSHSDYARICNNLGYLLLKQGHLNEASSLLSEAIDICRMPETKSPSLLAEALGSYAELQGRLVNYAKAEDALKESDSVVIAKLGPDHPSHAQNLIARSELSLMQHDPKTARLCMDTALNIYQKSSGSHYPQIATCKEMISWAHQLDGDIHEAASAAQEAFQIRYDRFNENSPILSEYDAFMYCQGMQRAANLYFNYVFDGKTTFEEKSLIAQTMLQAKGIIFSGMALRNQLLRTNPYLSTNSIVERYRAAVQTLSLTYNLFPLNTDSSVFQLYVDSLTQVVHELETAIARKVAGISSGFESNVDPAAIAKQLPDDALLLEYLYVPSVADSRSNSAGKYIVAAIDNAGLKQVVDLGPSSAIDTAVSAYRQHMQRITETNRLPTANSLEEYRPVVNKLYDFLLRPVEQLLHETQNLIISPDGDLCYLSFAGLLSPDGDYLIESHPLRYVSAGRDLLRRQNLPKQSTGLFAVGDPDFESASASNRLNSKLSRLPGTRREVISIGEAWNLVNADTAQLFLGAKATERAFKTHAQRKKFVHIATHGYYTSAHQEGSRVVSSRNMFINPLLGAGLHFAQEDSAYGELNSEDGILTALEVLTLDFAGTDAVVLSGCETGLGQVVPSEGILGLRLAFLSSGAGTVISSLWKVPDDATSTIMSALYKEPNMSPSDRLRQGQLKTLNLLRKAGFADHPFTWGAWVATGD